MSARHVPVTRPTYPVPITQITDTILLLYSNKWILVLFLFYRCWLTMPWEHHQFIIEGVELIPNRGEQLRRVAAFQIGAAYTAMKQGISTEDAERLADQTYSSLCMTRGIQYI